VAVADDDDLTASADATLTRALLENLLGNAWKYTARRPDARIEVGASVGREGVVYHVRDNGAGFDMAEAAKLFLPFQRLHAEEEFEGSGVGLATVERIVSRHGGRIWAEAAPGAGATFSFTLAQPSAERARRRAGAPAG
jgi:light-regulated signal transduction histidine kinase (bacteriophytochrome)